MRLLNRILINAYYNSERIEISMRGDQREGADIGDGARVA